jgi:GDPmannose 4,6-dehydratase
MKRALITGITGQDGSYLAELLLEKGYEVHGIIRRIGIDDPRHHLLRISHIQNKLHLHAGSIENYASIYSIFKKVRPQECYHLAAQSFVGYSFDDEFSTITTNISGTHHVLSALKEVVPKCRFYFAGSSEMFGNAQTTPQNEKTPFYPRSPYGISKIAGYHLVRNYRERDGLFAVCGILFNHESPRRGHEYVTRKIAGAVAEIKCGISKELRIGNTEACRDWGYAGDYVKAMWLMLQQKQPDDYVVATGKVHSVQEFIETAFAHAGLDWKKYVKKDKLFYRPETVILRGNARKARRVLKWKPEVTFDKLVHMMVDAEIEKIRSSPRLPQAIE